MLQKYEYSDKYISYSRFIIFTQLCIAYWVARAELMEYHSFFI